MPRLKSTALVVFSGGLDSTICLTIAKRDYSNVIALSFDYGQRHKFELKHAKKIAKLMDIEHRIVKIPTGIFQGSSLTNKELVVRKNSLREKGIPNTYVPGRNILFLSFATSFAESRNIKDILIGVNALDYSGYPDCRPEFIKSFEKTIQLGTKAGAKGAKIKIITPLINLNKKQIVEIGKIINAPIELSFSCYDPTPNGKPCGKCDSCILRKKGFKEAQVK
ncbi:MAG: 7-cyano-7-deazaguanine synthase QueC [Leptospiraceae bacterium]|nr:7-cyano-7-deazaguanine synthase QueC [Leptospiraceae bacterium]